MSTVIETELQCNKLKINKNNNNNNIVTLVFKVSYIVFCSHPYNKCNIDKYFPHITNGGMRLRHNNLLKVLWLLSGACFRRGEGVIGACFPLTVGLSGLNPG